MFPALPPLCLHEQDDLCGTELRLRDEVADWCARSIGPVEAARIVIEECWKGTTDSGLTFNVQLSLRVIRFTSEADMVAYKLRWR